MIIVCNTLINYQQEMSVFVSVCIILGVCYSYVPYNICPTYLEHVIKINIFAVCILVF